MATLGSVLLYRWHRAERHFYTDTPFLFAIGFFFIAAGEGVDAAFHSGLSTYVLTAFQVRSSLLGFALLFYFTATVLIWFIERRRLGYLITISYIALFLIAVWIGPFIYSAITGVAATEDVVRLFAMPFLLVVTSLLVATFLIAWAMKRLPDVHGLVISFGTCITMVGQFLKNPLAAFGIMWVSELIDLIGLCILFLGFLIKPGYAKASMVTV